MSPPPTSRLSVASARERLRARGLRWTPQRRALVEILARSSGHLTGVALVERSRAVDATTTPSTVYRTLDVLEELGLVRHSHGADGRQEYHVLPAPEHGHLICESCGQSWEIDAVEAGEVVTALERRRGFAVELSHLAIVGRCEACLRDEASRGAPA
jgi:Fur family ferric uptake transcriptional regulator